MDEELFDWELLNGSDTESTDPFTSNNKSASSSVIDEGMILSDHFSAENLIKGSFESTAQIQEGFIESGDSSRVDYGLGTQNPVNLGFDEFKVYRSADACVSNELVFYGSETGISGDGEDRVSCIEAADEKKHFESQSVAELTGGTSSHGVAAEGHIESESGAEESSEDSRKSWSDLGGNEMVSGDSGTANGEDEMVYNNTVEVVAENSAVRSGDESKSKETVWWKMPFVILKYCAFRIGPVWSVSMAAALMGLVLLGRRLYNMKKKTQRFQLKVTIDDKKVSRVMGQAARLNEVFTEVRRVHVIRPALPSPSTWPVLSLR